MMMTEVDISEAEIITFKTSVRRSRNGTICHFLASWDNRTQMFHPKHTTVGCASRSVAWVLDNPLFVEGNEDQSLARQRTVVQEYNLHKDWLSLRIFVNPQTWMKSSLLETFSTFCGISIWYRYNRQNQ